ncbi:MAG: AI-2E family transporter [Alphaproteobacteria bacterium]|nr:AI-2E family transporter [Alphaproteobacteria bacterium]
MNMEHKKRLNWQIWTAFWVGILIALWSFFTLFQSILAPFVLGMIVAYLFQPVVNAVERQGVPRYIGILVVMLGFLVVVLAVFLVVLPAVVAQAIALSEALPMLIERLRTEVLVKVEAELDLLGISREDIFGSSEEIVGTLVGAVRNWVSAFTGKLSSVASVVAFVILTPIVSIYMLNDWPSVVGSVRSILPKSYARTVVELAQAIDLSVSKLLRGLLIVALIMSTFYTVLFLVVGFTKYALLFGILTGFFVFVPYLGPISAMVIGTTLAYVDTGSPLSAALVLGVFLAGQGIEGYFVTPRLVGREIGLHPVWIIFALLGGGAVAGLPGFLVAMPMAAAIAATVRFVLNRYQHSRLYNEDDEDDEDAISSSSAGGEAASSIESR